MATNPTPLLNQDNRMLKRMRMDLKDKITAALADQQVDAGVHGVFSLDELESKTAEDLCRKIAVGVGYAGAEPWDPAKDQGPALPGGMSAKAMLFTFVVILAVPQGEDCQDTDDAEELLTVLKRKIMGTPISGDRTNRTWVFVKEAPNISVSTAEMLYYSQQWRVDLVLQSA